MFLLYNVFLNNEKHSEDVKTGLRVTAASSSQSPDAFSLDSISFGGRWHFNYLPNRSQATWLQESDIRFWLLIALFANTIEKE